MLYSWLRAHREKIAVGLASGEMTLEAICAECHRHGITSQDGSPPSRRAAQKAWKTVIQDLAALGVKPTDKIERPTYPSRMPKGWRPSEILPSSGVDNPGSEGARPIGKPAVPPLQPAAGLPAVSRPPPLPIVPPSPPEGTVIRSRLADPDDSPAVHAAYAKLEELFDEADWYLMGGPSKKRRTE